MAISDDDIDEAVEQVTSDVTDGTSTVSVDGMTVSQQDPGRRLDVIERLERRQVASSGNILSKLLRSSSRIVSHGGDE